MPEEPNTLVSMLLQRLHRYEFVALTLIAGGTGAALIAFQHQFAKVDIARDFGIALFAAGTIGLAVELHTRRTFRALLREDFRNAIDASSLAQMLADVFAVGSLTADLRELGVRRFYRTREHIKFAELIEKADSGTELLFLGVGLSGFVDRNTQGVIENKLSHNCSVKFLVLDARSDAVAEHGAAENRRTEDIKKDIEGAQILHDTFVSNRLAQNLRSRIELGHYASVPRYFIFSTTQTMIVGFYLRGLLGEFCPAIELEIKERGLHLAFRRHFDLLWESRMEARPAD